MRAWRNEFRLIFLLLTLCFQPRDSLAQAPFPPVPMPSPPPGDRPVSWKLLLPNVIHDQKTLWLFPKAVAEGRHSKPTLAFLSITVGLTAFADSPAANYFRNTHSFTSFNQAFSGRNTAVGMATVPFSMYLYGLARHKPYPQHTFLLAAEAALDSDILTTLAKDVDRRQLPRLVPGQSDFRDAWFSAHGHLLTGTGSFPGGHTITAFSIATVLADRYPRPQWHRWVAFGLAGLVGFSRLPLQAHYLSDEFAGAMLGYCIAHYVVRRNAMNSGSRLEERVTRKPTPGTAHAAGTQEPD